VTIPARTAVPSNLSFGCDSSMAKPGDQETKHGAEMSEGKRRFSNPRGSMKRVLKPPESSTQGGFRLTERRSKRKPQEDSDRKRPNHEPGGPFADSIASDGVSICPNSQRPPEQEDQNETQANAGGFIAPVSFSADSRARSLALM